MQCNGIIFNIGSAVQPLISDTGQLGQFHLRLDMSISFVQMSPTIVFIGAFYIAKPHRNPTRRLYSQVIRSAGRGDNSPVGFVQISTFQRRRRPSLLNTRLLVDLFASFSRSETQTCKVPRYTCSRKLRVFFIYQPYWFVGFFLFRRSSFNCQKTTNRI